MVEVCEVRRDRHYSCLKISLYSHPFEALWRLPISRVVSHRMVFIPIRRSILSLCDESGVLPDAHDASAPLSSLQVSGSVIHPWNHQDILSLKKESHQIDRDIASRDISEGNKIGAATG